MPHTGIESATLRSLARRSNQLSYAASYANGINNYQKLIRKLVTILQFDDCFFKKWCIIAAAINIGKTAPMLCIQIQIFLLCLVQAASAKPDKAQIVIIAYDLRYKNKINKNLCLI